MKINVFLSSINLPFITSHTSHLELYSKPRYHNAFNFLSFKVGAYSRGALIRGGAYIIASIIHEIHKCDMQEFCYISPFTSTFYAQITRQ